MNQVIEPPVAAKAAKPIKRAKTQGRIAKVPPPIRQKRIADLVRGKVKPLELNFLRASDPELMLYSLEEKRIVSSIPVLKHDKHNPIDLGDGIKMFSDNVLLEIPFPPSKTTEGMIKTIRKTFERAQEYIGDKYRLLAQAAHIYPEQDLQKLYGISPLEVGCNHSYNAWSLSVNNPTEFHDGLRSGSFHLHLGHKRLKDFQTRINAIRLLDIYVGCAEVLFSQDETSVLRRRYYGTASDHRCPEHGAEYRSLSNFSLRSHRTVELVLDLTEHAFDHIRNGTATDFIAAFDPEIVQKAINTCDKALAMQVLGKTELPNLLMKRVLKDYSGLDLYSEWKL